MKLDPELEDAIKAAAAQSRAEGATSMDGLGVDDVKMWLTISGKGHILISTNGGWNMTACHMMTPNGERSPYRPNRKCGKCMAELPKLRIATPNVGGPQ